MADNAVQTKEAITSRVESDCDVIIIAIFGRSADGGRFDDSQRQAAEAGAKRAMNAVDAEYQAASSLLFNALSEGKASALHATLSELEGETATPIAEVVEDEPTPEVEEPEPEADEPTEEPTETDVEE